MVSGVDVENVFSSFCGIICFFLTFSVDSFYPNGFVGACCVLWDLAVFCCLWFIEENGWCLCVWERVDRGMGVNFVVVLQR